MTGKDFQGGRNLHDKRDIEKAAAPDDERAKKGKYQAETNRAEQLVGVVEIHNLYGAYFVGRTDLVGDAR